MLLFFVLLAVLENSVQEIPLGTWRAHVSFSNIHSVAVSPNKIYAASTGGIQVFDKSDNAVSSYTKVNGLSSAGITAIAFDASSNKLVIAYEDGNLDILGESGFFNYSALKNLTTITGSKRISDISFNAEFAYLSTDYGIVVFDLNLLEVKETFRDLGPNGEKMQVYESVFYKDSIFVATESGVLAGNPGDNLLDFNKWKRYDTGDFNNAIQSIETFNGKLYVGINALGIYSYSGTWTKESYLEGASFRRLNAGNDLYITTETELWKVDAGNTSMQLTDPLFNKPNIGIDDGPARWIGDDRNGLIQGAGVSYAKVSVNAPSFNVASRLRYTTEENRVFSVSGGRDDNNAPQGNMYQVNYFATGNWNSLQDLLGTDVTDVVVDGSVTYVSSFGAGVQVSNNGTTTLYDNSNSPLESTGGPNGVYVTALAKSNDGIWVANYGATKSLHLLKSDGTWSSVQPPNAASRYVTRIVLDYLGNVWMALDPTKGGGIWVYNRTTQASAYLTEIANLGNLPSRFVYTIAADKSGQMWVGTEQGVAYFPDPTKVYSPVKAVKPVFDGSLLFKDDRVTTIVVDGGNRKWFGTDRGVWLLTDAGDEEVHNFNVSNSPVLSNGILDIEIQAKTGEVFISTDKGLVSFRADATESISTFQSVKIFPNPVDASFNGLVGISGLATDAIVKITDVSGKVVWQTTANGGTASWNVRDYNGRRPSTGIYLVFSTSADGAESIVGKIAIVN